MGKKNSKQKTKNKGFRSILTEVINPWWQLNQKHSLGHKFLIKFTNFCCHLPKSIRTSIMNKTDLFSVLISRTLTILSEFSLNAYNISGIEKNSKKKVELLILGKKNTFSYILDLLFEKEPEIKKLKKIKIKDINEKMKKISSDFDAIFVKCDRFYSRILQKQGFMIIPRWINMSLDTSKNLEDIKKNFTRSAKEDINKVKKYEYSYEFSEDIDKLRMFYSKMYLPHITKRYGDSAIRVNFETLRHLFLRNNKLMLIKLDNEYVFGTLFSVKKDKILATYAGLINSKTNLFKKGVSAAAYYFLIQWAKQNKIKYIDFGKCRAFLNDGGYKYKKKWGTNIKKAHFDSAGIFAFKKLSDKGSIKCFLKKNPFFYIEDNKIKTYLFNTNKNSEGS
jgi:hypothetical protein